MVMVHLSWHAVVVVVAAAAAVEDVTSDPATLATE